MDTFKEALRTDWQITLPFMVLYLAATFSDFLFGLAVAFAHKKAASSISRAGIMRKMLMAFTVLLACLFDGLLLAVNFSVLGFEVTITFGGLAAVWWLVNELLSITEHAAVLGIPIPKRVRESLAIVRHYIDSRDDDKPAQ
jgi:toxin secretion/phage lysis holin